VLAPRLLHRHSSTETAPLADLEASLQAELTSRPANEIYEYLNNTNSHLLNLTLADFLPSSCYPPGFSTSDLRLPKHKSTLAGDILTRHPLLALGHHLVYFSPQVLNSDLLPDGTDSLHSPGPPFVRRLWTGGSLSFNRNTNFQLHTGNMAALCKEEISKVWTKGHNGDEKVFLTVSRRIGGFGKAYKPRQFEGNPHIDWGTIDSRSDQWGLKSKMGKLAVVETKNLVFMREKPQADARKDAKMSTSTAMKVLKRRQNLF
jgi:hydroxyacyl-ACP dehydratase HTD2-like protein with hotdog domain